MIIRKGTQADLASVEQLYNDIHTAEETGQQTIGWIRGVYPTRATAQAALDAKDLFVLEDAGKLLGAARINIAQVDSYAEGDWEFAARDEEVCVLHTLVVSPSASGKGYGKKLVKFYEDYALSHGCPELRMDTNARNAVARGLYKKLSKLREFQLLQVLLQQHQLHIRYPVKFCRHNPDFLISKLFKEKRAGEFVEIQICLLFLYRVPSPRGACGRKLVLIIF